MDGTIQETEITRTDLERLSDDFLMRMLRILAIQGDWPRASVTADFLPDYLRERVIGLILEGPGGLEEIRSQAREGRNIFQSIRPTEREKELEEIIMEHIKSRGGYCEDIVREMSCKMGKKLSVSDIEDIVLVCVKGKYFDIVREAANNLPLIKRAQVIAIFC